MPYKAVRLVRDDIVLGMLPVKLLSERKLPQQRLSCVIAAKGP